MCSMHHVKGAAMNLKEGLEQWSKNNDPEFKSHGDYKYDHIALKLINEYAWLRVPYWIPGVETHPVEGIVWEQEKK
mgnify:FL=1